MALGSNSENNGKLFVLKLRTQDQEKKQIPPVFSVMEKVDGKFRETSQVRDISGRLSKVELSTGEYEGNEYNVVKVHLVDDEKQENYLLDLRLNSVTRNLANNLCGLSEFDGLKIGLYERKDKTTGKLWPAVSVRRNDQLTPWLIEPKDLPAPKKVTIGKKVLTDFSELDDLFLEKLTELSERLSGSKPVQKQENPKEEAQSPAPAKNKRGPKPKNTAPEAPTEQAETGETPVDDCPF